MLFLVQMECNIPICHISDRIQLRDDAYLLNGAVSDPTQLIIDRYPHRSRCRVYLIFRSVKEIYIYTHSFIKIVLGVTGGGSSESFWKDLKSM